MKKYAVCFNTTSEGDVLSYRIMEYNNYLIQVKNAGHKPQLYGFLDQTTAEYAANSFVGVNLTDTVVAERLADVQKKSDSVAEAAGDRNDGPAQHG